MVSTTAKCVSAFVPAKHAPNWIRAALVKLDPPSVQADAFVRATRA